MTETTSELVLEKDAFDEDVTQEYISTEPEMSEEARAKHVEISTNFDDIQVDPVLVHIAKTNQLDITWEKLQRILDSLINKQCTAMEDKVKDEEIKKEVEALSTRITHGINEHSNCPFTIQRLCELVIEPKKYYKMYVKYLRAVDKILSVTSYWEDFVNSETNKQGEDNKVEVPLLLPSFSVELEPHHFEMPKGEEEEEDKVVEEEEQGDVMEDVTKDEQVVEKIIKDDEEVSKDETTDAAEEAKMDLD